MKVVLDSVDSKFNLLRKSKTLREKQDGNWARVFVHQDLTPKQRSRETTRGRAESKESQWGKQFDNLQRHGSKEKRLSLEAGELSCLGLYINAGNLVRSIEEFEAWVHDINLDRMRLLKAVFYIGFETYLTRL